MGYNELFRQVLAFGAIGVDVPQSYFTVKVSLVQIDIHTDLKVSDHTGLVGRKPCAILPYV